MILKAKQSFNQLKDEAKSQGAKLGFFISALNVEDKYKEAILAILPKMSLEQIDRLIAIFEAQYTQQETTGIDESFKKELQNIKDKYDKDIEKVDNKVIEGLEKLTAELK
ncbi:MAG: hypothetical protein ACKKL6_03270 [Candidatus Komeilibacteria bacterium]